MDTWWLIPLSKWVITPLITGISRLNPLTIGVITHLVSGMNHQVAMAITAPNRMRSMKAVRIGQQTRKVFASKEGRVAGCWWEYMGNTEHLDVLKWGYPKMDC